MPAVVRADPKTVFSADEWRHLTSRSRWRGAWLVTHAWGTIALSVALVALWPNPLTWLFAVMVVGTRQLGLAILMHEAAHGGLMTDQRLNDWVGKWLCAVPVGADLASYRSYHLKHHKFTQQPEDPDLSLSAPFPITRPSFRRKAIRDLTGQTFYRQRFPLFMALFTRAAGDSNASQSFLSAGADKTLRFLGANALLFGICLALGVGVWFWAVWIVAMATWLPFVTRVRNIAEHACTSTGPDPFSHARTTRANLVERALIAPYWVNYHAEHHLFMYLPCYRLPDAHRMLIEKGLIARVAVAPGYGDVLRMATAKGSPIRHAA